MLDGGCNLSLYFIYLGKSFPALTNIQLRVKSRLISSFLSHFFFNVDKQFPGKSLGRYMRRSEDAPKRPRAFLEHSEGFSEQGKINKEGFTTAIN